MNANLWLNNGKLLNVVEKSSEDDSIHWFEGVIMQDSDVNTIVIDKNVAPDLIVNEEYDFLIRVTESLKSSKSGQVFKNNKFKIIDFSIH